MTRRRFSASAYMARLLEFEGRCACCGCKTGGANGLDWDHIIPLAAGGEDEMGNLQPLCKGCHKAKTAGDQKTIGKVKRQQQRAAGIGRTVRNPLPGSKASGWRKKLNGEVVPR